jgi:SWI/SNF-related matrix-associated actin-dependent regulator 1 of chromatin subfamily A
MNQVATSGLSIAAKGKNKAIITFPYDPGKVAAVKEINGRSFDPATKGWEVPLNVDSCLSFLDFCFAYDYELDDELYNRVNSLVDEARRRDLTRGLNKEQSGAYAADLEVVGLGPGITVRPFQKAGIAYILRNSKVLLGDDMGLGKTGQSICAVQQKSAFPCLVLCPAAVKYNWEREWGKWVPSRPVTVLDTKENKNPDFTRPVIVVNYDQLDKFLPQLLALDLQAVICDESHMLKSKKTKRYGLVSQVVKKADVRLLLTGTPVVNMPYDLIAQLNLLGVLPQFGGEWKFVNRYCGATRTAFGMNTKGASNLNELHEKLREICYIRRLKTEVVKELPPKTRNVIPVQLSNAKEYARAEENVLKYLGDKAETDKEFKRSLGGLSEAEKQKAIYDRRQAAINKGAAAEHLVRMNALLSLCGAGKIQAAIGWIEDFLENTDEKLIVFAVHTDVVNAIADHFNAPRIMGETSLVQREKNRQYFCEEPTCRVLVLNLQAGGTGIDGLQHVCNHALFVEQGWTPAVHNQAEDRVNRIGQLFAVFCHYIIARLSIDMQLYDLIDKKRSMSDAVIDGVAIENEQAMMAELMQGMRTRQVEMSLTKD